MKKLLTLLFIFGALSAGAQNLPTIVSYSVDTLCSNSQDALAITITIEDLDGDSTYFYDVSPNDTYTYYNGHVEGPATFSGETQRTFQIYLDGGFNYASPGLNDASINILVEGNATNDGGYLDQDLTDLKVYSDDLGVTVDWGTTTFCTNDNPVDMTPFTSHPGGYTIHGTSGEYYMENGFSPYDFFYDSGDGLEYHWTNSHGCKHIEFTPWPSIYEAPSVSVLTTESTCGNADGSATATFFGGQGGPYNVLWTNGYNETGFISTSQATNLSSGTYYVNVTDDMTGCTSQAPAQISDADIVVTENITNQSCPGAGNGAIDLTISGGTPDEIWWSNGSSTEDISGLVGGDYTVQIHTTGNCQAFKTYTVGSPAPIEINVDNLDAEDCVQGDFNSGIYITTTGGSGNFTWNWDSGAWTMEDFDSDPGVGNHNCVVTDQVTGCTYSWDINIPDYGAPFVFFDNVVKPNCNQNNGAIDAYVGVNFAPIATIEWNTGATTEDISGLAPGFYEVTVTDDNGCFTKESVTIENKRPQKPTICLLTVDTSFTYNQVIWEKTGLSNVAGFNVYRETQVQGVFEKVAQRPWALESYYMDNIASPQDRSWRYYLTTYDACGGESYPSFIHKTIHCIATPGGGSDYEVYWDDYEGINYSSVDLKRYDPTNGWQTIGNYSPGTNHETDQPPVTTGLEYIVSFNLVDPCITGKAQDYNSSRSNNTNGEANPGGTSLNVEDEEMGEISVYPNPTNGEINVYVENPDLFELIEVRDVNGALIMSQIMNSSQTELDLSSLSNGMYFVRLISESTTINHKITKR